tara:strand:+ start:3141 stop:4031 length:891 start_codon:yes stop_codon:yes gene_type:complete
MQYNIYLAFTPLHLKIINSIPKKNNSILIILNKKNLNRFCNSYVQTEQFYKIYKFKSLFFNPFILMKINSKFQNINTVYAGNFKFFNFRLIQFFIDYKKLITFDDGVGGVSETYFNTNSNTIKEKIYSLFKLDILSIMSKHAFHYAIYDAQSSIFGNSIIPLNLEDISERFNYDGNVLLTTDKSEAGTMSKDDENRLLEKIIKNFNIKYLIHHPSKRFNRNFNNVQIIDEPYLSDDIVSYSKFNHVYSLSASSILGIVRLKKIPDENLTYLANKDAPVMQMLHTNTKINTINFEDL